MRKINLSNGWIEANVGELYRIQYFNNSTKTDPAFDMIVMITHFNGNDIKPRDEIWTKKVEMISAKEGWSDSLSTPGYYPKEDVDIYTSYKIYHIGAKETHPEYYL